MARWYAVQHGTDTDCGYGHEKLESALTMAATLHEIYPDEPIILCECSSDDDFCTKETILYSADPNEIDGRTDMLFGDIAFDDWAEYVDDSTDGLRLSYWTEICPECADKYKQDLGSRVDAGTACGTCGVKGCENQADAYVDFNSSEVFFRKEIK